MTSADMMSVTVALSSVSSSSVGPGMGSCCVRCSTRRISCLFCQIISANFSHLHSQNKNMQYYTTNMFKESCKQFITFICYISVTDSEQWRGQFQKWQSVCCVATMCFKYYSSLSWTEPDLPHSSTKAFASS